MRSLVNDTADMDAEDFVQDVLLRVLERNSGAGIEDVTAYVYRSLKNRVIDYARVHKPSSSLDEVAGDSEIRLIELLHDHKPDALEFLLTEQGKNELFIALDSLSDIEKQVVVAHELEGVPFKDLEHILKIPQNTLLSHKSRAMRKLKKYYVNREGD